MLWAYRYGSRKPNSYVKHVLQYLDLGSETAERLCLLIRGKKYVKIRVFIIMARTMMGMPRTTALQDKVAHVLHNNVYNV